LEPDIKRVFILRWSLAPDLLSAPRHLYRVEESHQPVVNVPMHEHLSRLFAPEKQHIQTATQKESLLRQRQERKTIQMRIGKVFDANANHFLSARRHGLRSDALTLTAQHRMLVPHPAQLGMKLATNQKLVFDAPIRAQWPLIEQPELHDSSLHRR
jgi:hypothetical protein